MNSTGLEHAALNQFFRSPTMLARADSTRWRYAHSLRVWLNFLDQVGGSWDTATAETLSSLKSWRRSSKENPDRIGGRAWTTDLAAYFVFYRWAAQRFGVEGPFSGEEGANFTEEMSSKRFATNRVRSTDVKWLTPAAYRRWRDVGILGFDRNGVEKLRWRHRCEERDQAFVDGLYRTGLRIQEWSSVLIPELPTRQEIRRFHTARLADACSKGGVGRDYWVRSDVLGTIQTYVEHERARAVQRGRASGLYENLPDLLVVDHAFEGGVAQATDRSGQRQEIDLNDLTPKIRLSLCIGGPDGLEPLHLWLNEDGSPRPKRAWYKTFLSANRRVRSEGIQGLRCHPHMLRHSFALRWYAIGKSVWENRVSHLSDWERRDFRDQFGDTWNVIQGLLGHSSVETTRSVYLEPFRNLSTALLLEQVDDDDFAQMQMRVLSGNPRVADDPLRHGGAK